MVNRQERRRRQRLSKKGRYDNTCPDCGIEPWYLWEDGREVHEDFYVNDELWTSTCPDDDCKNVPGIPGSREGTFVICIGCFEARLGRRLRHEDFSGSPEWLFGEIPPSSRFLDRYLQEPGDE